MSAKEWVSKATKFAEVYETEARKRLTSLRLGDIDTLLDWLDCEQLLVLRGMPSLDGEAFVEQRGKGFAIEELIARLMAVRHQLVNPSKEERDD